MCELSTHITKIEHRAVIKFLTKSDKSPKRIFEEMTSIYGESGPSHATVKKWSRLFKLGRESIEDDPRSGRPISVVTEENTEKVKKLVLEDRRIKVWQIAEALGISKERVGEILHQHLHMTKVSARWVPKMLTAFDRERRVQTSQAFLELCEEGLDEVCSRIVTVDETWIRQYDPESKSESMQWIEKGERPPKKFKVQRSASKLMATVFWDCDGILLIDYLAKGSTINAVYYAELLRKVRQAIVEKRRGKLSKGILFLQDNAPVHTARVAKLALKETGFEEIDHPPYSPDLAPSDYFLFSNLKKDLRGKRFGSDEEMKAAVQEHFDSQNKTYFFNGLKALFKKCNKCIELEGDYIEK